MPKASCDICIQSIYGTDIQICGCDAVTSTSECTHWRRHHAEINGLCISALQGCRMCSELWRFFFKEKTPEQYLASVAPGEFPGQGFLIGPAVHVFSGSGTSYRVSELAGGSSDQSGEKVLLALDFGINSPMIYEVERRRYVLKKMSGERLCPFAIHVDGTKCRCRLRHTLDAVYERSHSDRRSFQ